MSEIIRCGYDGCCTFEPATANNIYCTPCKCRRKRENSLKRLRTPIEPLSLEAWALQENRKLARVTEKKNKDQWLLDNKTFCTFDLETSNLDANFGEILCACIKPLNGPITTFSLPIFNPGEPWRLVSDAEIVGNIRDELRKYDYIITWYGTGFDMPFLTTRLVKADEEPLGFMRHIDLYYTAKFKLKLSSNRLASVGDFLFGKTKKDNYAGNTWLAALRGEKAALDYTIKHCEKDVEELERVFEALKPWRNIAETALRYF